MSIPEFSLEDLTEGPLFSDAPAAAPAAVEDDGMPIGDPTEAPVDEAGVQDATVEYGDEAVAVENATVFIKMSLEHFSVLANIAPSLSTEASVDVNHKVDLGLGNIWKAIKTAFAKLVEMIQKFITKIANFVRSGGVKEKLAYIAKGTADFKKIDGNKQVLDPEVVTEAAKVKGFKVPENIFEAVANAFGVDPTTLRVDVTEQAKKKVRLADAFAKAKSVCSDANLAVFTRGVNDTLSAAKSAQKKVDAKEKEKAGEDKGKMKSAAESSRVVLKKISDASFLGVRGFSWFLTVVNYTYGAIKATEGKSDK